MKLLRFALLALLLLPTAGFAQQGIGGYPNALINGTFPNARLLADQSPTSVYPCVNCTVNVTPAQIATYLLGSGNLFPNYTTGYLYWNGSSLSWNAAAGTGTVTTSGTLSQYQIPVMVTATALGGVTPPSTVGVPLIGQGSGTYPVFGAIALDGGSSIVTGILPITNGGTGAATLGGADIPIYTGSFTVGDCIDVAAASPVTFQDSGSPGCGGGGVVPGGVSGQIQYNNSGAFGGITTTGTGDVVLATGATINLANSTGLSLTTGVTGILPFNNGGTGIATIPANGDLLIGNGANYTLATLTAGNNISITDGIGAITIAATSGGTVNSAPQYALAYYSAAGTAVSGIAAPSVAGETLLSQVSGPPVWTAGAAPTNVQTFTSTGTWTNPGGTTTLVQCLGGGGSGGSGESGASGTASSGGSGGGSGDYAEMRYPTASLPSTVPVTIGAIATGGAAVTNGTGNPGSVGGNATFAPAGLSGLEAFGGGAGQGGALSAASGGGGGAGPGAAGNAGSAGTGGAGITGSGVGGSGASAASSNFTDYGVGGGGGISGAAGGSGANSSRSGTGAGAGGGLTAGPAATNGGTSGASPMQLLAGTGSSASAGINGTASTGAYGGTGGSGGASNQTGNGYAGGTGAPGAPGGGGGSAISTHASGAGGNGGTPQCVVTTSF